MRRVSERHSAPLSALHVMVPHLTVDHHVATLESSQQRPLAGVATSVYTAY